MPLSDRQESVSALSAGRGIFCLVFGPNEGSGEPEIYMCIESSRESEPVGGKSLPGAEEIGRGGESFAGKVSLQKEKVSLWEGKVCQGRKIRREERRSPGEEQRPSEEKSKTPRQKPRHLTAPYQASSDRSFKNF